MSGPEPINWRGKIKSALATVEVLVKCQAHRRCGRCNLGPDHRELTMLGWLDSDLRALRAHIEAIEQAPEPEHPTPTRPSGPRPPGGFNRGGPGGPGL